MCLVKDFSYVFKLVSCNQEHMVTHVSQLN